MHSAQAIDKVLDNFFGSAQTLDVQQFKEGMKQNNDGEEMDDEVVEDLFHDLAG